MDGRSCRRSASLQKTITIDGSPHAISALEVISVWAWLALPNVEEIVRRHADHLRSASDRMYFRSRAAKIFPTNAKLSDAKSHSVKSKGRARHGGRILPAGCVSG
jgi:hypothetical protein